jgi:hypothetical protein
MNGVVGSNRLRSKAAASLETGESDGGNVDEILKRLGIVETSVAEIRAVMPHLATRADLNALKAELKDEIHSARAETQSVRVEVQAVRGEMNLLRADMNSMETRMIKWMIGTTISTAALAFSVAKLVH